MKKLIILMLCLVACGRRPVLPEKGDQGVPGTPGVGCSAQNVPISSVAPNGGALVTCGTSSPVLLLNGTNGLNGSNGSNGTNGTPGTIVSAIKFCPNSVAHYPSVFPEVGFCISTHLYAVYSTLGGFLTEVTPGSYTSNAVGSSCNFNVSNNCVVQPL